MANHPNRSRADQIETLDELLEFLASGPTLSDARSRGVPVDCGEIDYTSLPTFGGDEPSDTQGVWSWDETRLLVGYGSDLEIVGRKEFFEQG